MEEPFLQRASCDYLNPREDEASEFVTSLLEAFSNPVDSECWCRVHEALRALESSASQLELRGRKDLLHYLDRLSAFLHSENKQVPQRGKLLQSIQRLRDIISDPNGSSEIRAPRGLLVDASFSTYDKYHPLEKLSPEIKMPLLSTHGKHQDDLFLYDPSCLPSYSPHPPPPSIADLRHSLPAVLSQVARLHRGRMGGLGITEQPLDLHFSSSLPLTGRQSPDHKVRSSISPPAKLLPLPQGLNDKAIAKIQMKCPKTGGEVIKYFACGGENRFFYLQLDPSSPCYDPYRLVVFSDSPPSCKEFYTMSAFGVFRNLSDGTTESSSLVTWHREATLFKGLRTLPFFRLFSLLKAIRRWKRMTALSKQEKVREFLHENLLLQVPCFTPVLYSASQWSPVLLALERFPQTPAQLLPIECVAGKICKFRRRVLSEVKLLYAQGSEQLEQLCRSLRQELSYCEQSIELEDRRAAGSKALPLSTQSRSLRKLMQQRSRVLTAVKLIPRLSPFLDFCMLSALKQHSLAAAGSYLSYLSIGPQEESPPAISLVVDVLLENGVFVMDCLTKRSDLYDVLLAPFGDHYLDLEKIDRPLLSEMTRSELKKASKVEEEKPISRTTRLSFVRQVMAHSILSEEQNAADEKFPYTDHRRGSEPGVIHTKKQRMLKSKLLETTNNEELALLAVLRKANAEISTKLDFLKWMLEMISFIQVWGTQEEFNLKMCYSDLIRLYENITVWSERLESVPEVWSTEKQMFQLDLGEMKTNLSNRLEVAAENLFQVSFNQYCDCYNRFMEIIQANIQTISQMKLDAENFILFTQRFNQMKEDKNRMLLLKKELDEMYELLQSSTVVQVEDLEEKHAIIIPKWYKYLTYLQSISRFISGEQGNVVAELRSEFSEIERLALELVQEANSGNLTQWVGQPQENRDSLERIGREFIDLKFKMRECESQMLALVEEEEAVSLRTQIERVVRLQDKITTRKQLWDSVAIGLIKISEWYQKIPFGELKMKEVNSSLSKWSDLLVEMEQSISPQEEVIIEWKKKLETFKSYLPSLNLLSDPGMKSHFWQVLFTALGLTFPSNGRPPNINYLVSHNIFTYHELINRIHASAMVEGRLESILRTVMQTWKGKEYKLVKHTAAPFQGLGTDRQDNDGLMYLAQQQGFTSYVLQNEEDLYSLINHNSTQLQMIVESNCTSTLKKSARLWIDLLQQLAEFLSVWMDCQAKWIYLSSVFVEFDVLGTNKGEVENFKQIHTNYQLVVNSIFDNKSVMSLMCVKLVAEPQLKDEQDVLKGMLRTCRRELNEMMRPLKTMFDDARNIFARAFYLSESQILDLYVHTGNPKGLLPHLRLCFPGVHNVLWEADVSTHKLTTVEDLNKLGLKITGVYDVNGNIFKLICPLITRHQPGHFWLKGLERALKVSISDTIHRISSYIHLSNLFNPGDNPLAALLSSWHDHPLQCLSVALSLAWSHVVEASIDEKNKNLLTQLNVKLSQCTNNVIDEFTSRLENKKRFILSNILLRIHNLQQSLSRLESEFPLLHDNFLWATHFKYKYTLPESDFDQLIPVIAINHLNYSYPYCNEYQGGVREMVLTPLTEKCIFNLCLAMYTNQLGGIVGTKSADNSEVVRHLCGVLGRACFALDASTFQTHAQVTNALLGFIQSGTVGYLANLDKLTVSLSCTLATFLQAIKREIDKRLPYRAFLYFYDITPAGKDRDSIDWYSLEEFGVLAKLELGKEIPLMHGYGCCISISDDNLPKEFSNYLHTKIHYFYFSQPSYKQVLEALLLSSNFSSHRVLSSKVIAFFEHFQNLIGKEMLPLSTSANRLIAEAVHCLGSTGSLWKQENSRERVEMLAIYSALWRFVKTHLTKGEEVLVKSVLNSVFPDCANCVGILSQIDMQTKEFNYLEAILNRILVERQYRRNKKQFERIFDIYNSLNRRENVILYGPTLSGKTTSLQLLAHALSELHEESRHPESKYIHLTPIFPQTFDISTLYGRYDATTETWNQGLLHKLLANTLYSGKGREYWFLFDGRVDGDWITQIQYLLDDPKQFTGCDGYTLQLPETCRFIFETDSLHNATPALLSHCCLISMGGGIVSWRDLLEHWLQSLTVWRGIAEHDVIKLRSYSKQSIPTLLEYLQSVRRDGETSLPTDQLMEMVCVRNFTRLMSALLKKFYVYSCKFSSSNNSHDGITLELLHLMYIFSIAWGFGGSLDREGRRRFNRYLLDVLQQNNIASGLGVESGRTIYDYFINPSLSQLVPWGDVLTERSSYGGYINLPEFDKFSVLGELLLNDGTPLCFSGSVGVGKSGMVENLFQHRVKLSSLSYSPLWTPSRMQQRIRNVAETQQKRASNQIRSLDSEDRCILFIDDFNLPVSSVDGGCEDVLRQVLCTNTVYDSATQVMNHVSILFIICSNLEKPMLSVSSAKHNRFLSQFFHLTVDPPERDTLVKIFAPPTTKWLLSHLPYSETGGLAKDLSHILVETSIALFECVREKLVATPLTPHYSFTLFELNRLFQSLFLFTSKHTEQDKVKNKLAPSLSPFSRLQPRLHSSKKKLFKYGTVDIKSSFQREREINYVSFYQTLRQIVRFWCHEHYRVYGDKLSSEKDQEWFLKLLILCVRTAFCRDVQPATRDTESKTKTKSKLNRTYFKKENIIENNKTIDRLSEEVTAEKYRRMKVPFSKIFSLIEEVSSLMFLRRNTAPLPTAPLPTAPSRDSLESNCNKNLYTEVTDFGLKTQLQPHLDILNGDLRPKDNIILYPFALEHIARIARVLQTPESHLLFAAERKTGRRTLVRLAAALTQSRMLEMRAGADNDGLTHGLPILQEAISVSVASRHHVVVMLSGDWQPEVLHAIEELLSLEIVNPDKERMHREGEEGANAPNYYRASPIPDIFKHELFPPRYPPGLTRKLLRHNLHFVFLTNGSPAFFSRHCKLARFLTPYFLSPLCELSLREVALVWLERHAVKKWVDAELSLESLGEVAAHIHCTAYERATELLPDTHRWAYKSSIRMFIDLLKTSETIAYVIARKEAGLIGEVKKAQGNMIAARGELEGMRRDLGKLDRKKQGKLKEMRRFEAVMSAELGEYKNAEQLNRQHGEEIEGCKRRIEGIERELERKFGEVDPLYERAQEAIRTICKEDIAEVASFQKPPEGVKRITDSVCRLFNREVSWSSAQVLFRSKHFYHNLIYYDKERNMRTILSCLPEGFHCSEEDVERIEQCSKAAKAVAQWLIAIFRYAQVDRDTRAEKGVTAGLSEEVQRLERERGSERVKMNASVSQLESHNLALQEMRSEVTSLDERMGLFRSRIEDASRIFSSLQLVEAKFNNFIRKSEERVCSLGNVLITAGAINYLTPFPASMICEMVNGWRDFCGTIEEWSSELRTCTQATQDFSLLDVIASEEELFYWESKKELPQGEGYKVKLLLIRAVASFDSLWPYVYDPTGMFYKWMKNLETAFRGAEIESLFSLTRGYEESIRTSADLSEIRTLPEGLSGRSGPCPSPLEGPTLQVSEAGTPPSPGSTQLSPHSEGTNLKAVKSWNMLRMKSRAIFSTGIRLTRSYEEGFEGILETEMSKSSPVPVIALSMSCLPGHTSREVIYSQFQEGEKGRYCQLGGKEVTVGSEFRLYLVSNHSPHTRAVDAAEVEMERVRLCCFRPSREGLREILFSLIAEAEMGEVCAKRDTATRDVVYFYKLMKEKRKKLLKHIIDSPSIASDLALIQLISSTARELERAEEGRAEYQEACDKLQEELDVFRVVSDKLELVWQGVSGMERMCREGREYNFTLTGFLDTVQRLVNRTSTEAFKPVDGAMEGRVHQLSVLMLTEMCSFYLSQLVEVDKPVFLLSIIFSAQLSQDSLSREEWDAFFLPAYSIANCTELLNSLFSDFDKKRPVFVSPEVWAHLSQRDLPGCIAHSVDSLSLLSPEWEEYFSCCQDRMLDRTPAAGVALTPEQVLLLWREMQPRDFLQVLEQFLVHRLGAELGRMAPFRLEQACQLAADRRPLLIYTDVEEAVGDCLAFVRSHLIAAGELCKTFDLACKESIRSLESYIHSDMREAILLLNCELVSCWPPSLLSFLHVSYLCRFPDETSRPKHLIVITSSSALHRLPLSIRSSPVKLAYNHRYFTPSERVGMCELAIRTLLNRGPQPDSYSLPIKINAIINSGVLYDITRCQEKLAYHTSFLSSIAYFLHEFFNSSGSLSQQESFLAYAFPGSHSFPLLGREELSAEMPEFNRVLPGCLLDTERTKVRVSSLLREAAGSEVSLQLVELFRSRAQGRKEVGELDLVPLLELLDLLIADVITLLNRARALQREVIRSLQIGSLQHVLKKELQRIERLVRTNLLALQDVRASPKGSLHEGGSHQLQLVWEGYMPAARDGSEDKKLAISVFLVWYKEALEYYRRQLEGHSLLLLRYHQYPLAWVTACLWQQAKASGRQLERCRPVVKIREIEGNPAMEEDLLGIANNVSLSGVQWHNSFQCFSLHPCQSSEHQSLALYCVETEAETSTYTTASLYSLDISQRPALFCEVEIPLTRRSERDCIASGNPIMFLQK